MLTSRRLLVAGTDFKFGAFSSPSASLPVGGTEPKSGLCVDFKEDDDSESSAQMIQGHVLSLFLLYNKVHSFYNSFNTSPATSAQMLTHWCLIITVCYCRWQRGTPVTVRKYDLWEMCVHAHMWEDLPSTCKYIFPGFVHNCRENLYVIGILWITGTPEFLNHL